MLDKICKKLFACDANVELALKEFKKQCHLLGFEQTATIKVPTFSSPGRPKKNEKPTGYQYFIEAGPFTELEKATAY